MTEILSLGFLAVPWRPENTRAEAVVRVGLTLCAVAVLAIFFSYVTNALDSPTWQSPSDDMGWDQLAE
ncbi:MAG: hypothetical protein WCC03_17050 [Candidatus Acidiferrales bacterium]